MNCDHTFISYDPENDSQCRFHCRECDQVWGYHPHDPVALDQIISEAVEDWNAAPKDGKMLPCKTKTCTADSTANSQYCQNCRLDSITLGEVEIYEYSEKQPDV